MSWTVETLVSVLADMRRRGGDSTLIEVKKATGGVPGVAETLCAFANMPDGGTLILGVDEKAEFAVTGVHDVAIIESGVAAQARGSVTPPVHTDFEIVETGGNQVLVVTVAPLPLVDKPCRVHGKAYLRQSDGDYVMSDQEVAQLMAMQSRPRWDATPVEGSSSSDLDQGLMHGFLAEARASSRRLADCTDTEVADLRGVTTGVQLSVAGLYAMGSYPQRYAPSLSITAAAAGPGGGQRMADLAHLDGPIPDLLDDCVAWVARNLRTGVGYLPDGHAVDTPEIPLIAVRELVANALVHRDLSPRTQSKRVEVRLLADRLVVTSPGGLWGVSQDSLGLPGGKSAVNEFLYDICRTLPTPSGRRIIEGEGGGIRETIDALAQAGLAAPTFIDTGVSFTAIIYRPAVGSPATSPAVSFVPAMAGATPAALILVALAAGPQPITDLVKQTSLSRRQVKYALDQLVNAGRVIVNGGQGNRFTTYRLGEDL